jgi:hypothetical protein
LLEDLACLTAHLPSVPPRGCYVDRRDPDRVGGGNRTGVRRNLRRGSRRADYQTGLDQRRYGGRSPGPIRWVS